MDEDLIKTIDTLIYGLRDTVKTLEQRVEELERTTDYCLKALKDRTLTVSEEE